MYPGFAHAVSRGEEVRFSTDRRHIDNQPRFLLGHDFGSSHGALIVVPVAKTSKFEEDKK